MVKINKNKICIDSGPPTAAFYIKGEQEHLRNNNSRILGPR